MRLYTQSLFFSSFLETCYVRYISENPLRTVGFPQVVSNLTEKYIYKDTEEVFMGYRGFIQTVGVPDSLRFFLFFCFVDRKHPLSIP